MKDSILYKVSLPVAKMLYPAETLLKTAYRFLDRCYIHVDEAETHWIIRMQPKNGTDGNDCAAEFENELIAQTVRRCVSQQTSSLRELLIARAMASTMILEDDPSFSIEAQGSDLSDDELREVLTNWFDHHA